VKPAPAPAAKPAPAPEAKPAAAAAAAPAPAPAPVAAPAPAPKAPEPAQAAPKAADPGGEVAVKATKAGLTKVGVAGCKMCHKVQFASWSASDHAKRTPPVDCEGCHGPGSEYKALAVMKDPAKAKAAGLVTPGAAFCATCHKKGWTDAMLKKVHAHKA
jgi:hypothetical protein